MTVADEREHKENVPENTPGDMPQGHGRTYLILAVAIAALVGLGVGWLVFRDTGSDAPVEATEPATAGVEFPTGGFLNDDNDGYRVLTFDEDGTYAYNINGASVWGEYTVDGDLFTDVANDAQPLSAPATYIWTYEGDELSFELSGEDTNPYRAAVYARTYTRTE